MQSKLFILTSIAQLFALTIANPISAPAPAKSIFKREEVAGKSFAEINDLFEKRQCEQIPFTVSQCTSCFSTGDGLPVCDTDPYVHFGGLNAGSCDDQQAPFEDDFCTAYDNIPTPIGQGEWNALEGCTDPAQNGYSRGLIYVPINNDPNSLRVCNCAQATGNYHMWCGIDFACDNVYDCRCC